MLLLRWRLLLLRALLRVFEHGDDLDHLALGLGDALHVVEGERLGAARLARALAHAAAHLPRLPRVEEGDAAEPDERDEEADGALERGRRRRAELDALPDEEVEERGGREHRPREVRLPVQQKVEPPGRDLDAAHARARIDQL